MHIGSMIITHNEERRSFRQNCYFFCTTHPWGNYRLLRDSHFRLYVLQFTNHLYIYSDMFVLVVCMAIV